MSICHGSSAYNTTCQSLTILGSFELSIFGHERSHHGQEVGESHTVTLTHCVSQVVVLLRHHVSIHILACFGFCLLHGFNPDFVLLKVKLAILICIGSIHTFCQLCHVGRAVLLVVPDLAETLPEGRLLRIRGVGLEVGPSFSSKSLDIVLKFLR